MSGDFHEPLDPDRGCDWVVAGERCERADLAVTGDGSHVCFAHVDRWRDAAREVLARLEAQRIEREEAVA